MTSIEDWPSLAYEHQLAHALFGPTDRVPAWLSQELSRTEDIWCSRRSDRLPQIRIG